MALIANEDLTHNHDSLYASLASLAITMELWDTGGTNTAQAVPQTVPGSDQVTVAMWETGGAAQPAQVPYLDIAVWGVD